MRRGAAPLAALLLVVSLRPVAALAATATSYECDAQPVVYAPMPVTVTLTNLGPGDVTVTGAPSFSVAPSTAVDLEGAPSGGSGAVISSGASQSWRGTFRPLTAGPFTLSVSVPTSAGTKSWSIPRTAVDASGVQTVGTPPLGTIQVRRGFVRVNMISNSDAPTTAALVVVHGPPGGHVDLNLVAPSGLSLGAIYKLQAGSADLSGRLDAQGLATFIFDGRINSSEVGSGIYWIVATGDVNDRKPVVVFTNAK